VRLLPDTHALLWLVADDQRLTRRADALLADPRNEVLLSAAVTWEVAIEQSLGRLRVPHAFATTVLGHGATPLPITIAHSEVVTSLPWHHGDPFDRMLVAQASLEDAVIVSGDDRLREYGVRVEW
jgi:PIN domain nuclease of toxin-antitoxin system